MEFLNGSKETLSRDELLTSAAMVSVFRMMRHQEKQFSLLVGRRKKAKEHSLLTETSPSDSLNSMICLSHDVKKLKSYIDRLLGVNYSQTGDYETKKFLTEIGISDGYNITNPTTHALNYLSQRSITSQYRTTAQYEPLIEELSPFTFENAKKQVSNSDLDTSTWVQFSHDMQFWIGQYAEVPS